MQQVNQDPRDPLFKGCTRPAMQFGVPLKPLILVTFPIILFSMYTTLLLLVTLIPVIIVMRQIAKTDDQQFRLLGQKIKYRANNRNGRIWKNSTYSPVDFRRKNIRYVS